MSIYSIRPMSKSDLEQVRQWRNHEDVRKFMYTKHEIGEPEHRAWYQGMVSDPSKQVLVFDVEHVPQGFVQFVESNDNSVAEWGFYTAPNAPKGTGRLLGLHALDHAFEHGRFRKICGQALACNVASVQFHISLGFEKEGVLRKQFFDGENFCDVVRFGLLEVKWRESRLKILRRICRRNRD